MRGGAEAARTPWPSLGHSVAKRGPEALGCGPGGSSGMNPSAGKVSGQTESHVEPWACAGGPVGLAFQGHQCPGRAEAPGNAV